MSSGRFAIATHALALLAQTGESCASDELSASINTNPAFLRRILARLSQAGLIEAREGRAGGYRLARPAKRIRLSEVYAAVEPEGAIAPSPCEPDAKCPIGAGIQRAFDEVADAANEGLLRGLSQRTVADIALRAQHLGRPAPAPVKAR
ncbi:Rrf2 family transcriptional regulator [Sorangium sp. So ce887]|uniref:Rrf2 family transcriptional regulator n=1 Tax=Sorangium sp. So ce887 TaxID=3133324 RepID=UPI003F5F889D